MALSILYPQGAKSGMPDLDPRILYKLSLDRAFAEVCADIKKREYFLEVTATPVPDRATVEFRQDILKDFYRLSGFFERFASLYAELEELHAQNKDVKKTGFVLNLSGTATASSKKSVLEAQALCLKRTLLCIRSFDILLENYAPCSAGLTVFQKTCREICRHPDFEKMLAFCSKYEYLSASNIRSFRFTLDDACRIEHYELTDNQHIHVTDPDLKQKGLNIFRRTNKEVFPCQRLVLSHPGSAEKYRKLTVEAISDLSGALAAVAKQIFETFSPIYRELDFYFVALQYMRVLSEKNIPFCFPDLSKRGVCIRGLLDPYLCLSVPNPQKVVSNDVEIPENCKGLLIFGNNGSGKTVFLRSFGCAQFLAQAGLPVLAESAEIPLCTQIAAQFSEAEKEFCAGNDAGRFEQEVRELSEMVETLKKGALVLLNETFQSTSYTEGGEALCDLLNYFGNCGIRFVLVSHLHTLEEQCKTDVKILHTAQKYKIV